MGELDVTKIRKDFPIFEQTRNGKPIVFLDSAASSQRPNAVIEAMQQIYRNSYANVHRGVYDLAEQATAHYEDARRQVARFINAASEDEVIFTKNATESLNLVVGSWGRANLGPNDAVVLTMLEHHANIVPWQMLASEIGFEIRWIPLTDDARLDLSSLDRLLDGAKALSFSAMSNVTGTITPIVELTAAARAAGAISVIDACQHVVHAPTDVQAMGVDLLAFSGHKMLGPTGIGVLWGRSELLESMPAFLGGGGMIRDVTTEGFTVEAPPARFEAGTPPIVEAVGLAAAIEYLEKIGMDAICKHDSELTKYAMKALSDSFGPAIRVFGPTDSSQRCSVISFELDSVHAHDVSQILDQNAICTRPGHHCAKPLMKHLGVQATVRASFYIYNDFSDVDALTDALFKARDFFVV